MSYSKSFINKIECISNSIELNFVMLTNST